MKAIGKGGSVGHEQKRTPVVAANRKITKLRYAAIIISSSYFRLRHTCKPVLSILLEQLSAGRPIWCDIHWARMKHHKSLERRICQIYWTPTLLTEMAKQRVTGLGCFVGVLLDHVFTLSKSELGFDEAVVVRKS